MKLPIELLRSLCKAHTEGIASGMLNDKTNPYPSRSPRYICWNIGNSEGWAIRAQAIIMNEGRQ